MNAQLAIQEIFSNKPNIFLGLHCKLDGFHKKLSSNYVRLTKNALMSQEKSPIEVLHRLQSTVVGFRFFVFLGFSLTFLLL